MKRYTAILCVVALTISTAQLYAQKVTKVDLGRISGTFNRSITSVKGSPVMKVNEGPDAGGVWLRTGSDISNAEIELEIKGADLFQKSFVGIAFHGQNETTYEAVYFRPFNFRASDPERAKHAVQYISLPGNDWPKLRAEQPLKYEQPINAAADPNDWFKVKLVLLNGNISVYLNGADSPCLQVKSLSTYKSGKIGLWTGNDSAGEFRNMTIRR